MKSGVIFFPDYSSNIVNNTTNPPVFSFYKYIGRKGISELIKISSSQPQYPVTNQILLNTSSKKLQLWNGSSWDDYGGGGGGINSLNDVTIGTITTDNVLYHDGSNWINTALNTSNISEHSSRLYYTDSRVTTRINNTSINALNDVNTTSALGDVLSWNGHSWIPTVMSTPGSGGYASYSLGTTDITADFSTGLTNLSQVTSLASFGNIVTYSTNYFTFSDNGKYKISISGLFRTTNILTSAANAPTIYLSYSTNSGTSWTDLANVVYLKNVAETNSIQKPFNTLSNDGIIEVADYTTFRIRVISDNFSSGSGAKCSNFRIDFMDVNPIYDSNPSSPGQESQQILISQVEIAGEVLRYRLY